jgi:hypothetical protein
MSAKVEVFHKQLAREIAAMPEEHLPNLLQIVRAFRQSVAPHTTEAEEGWREFDEMLKRARARFAESPMTDEEIATEVEAARRVVYDSRRH